MTEILEREQAGGRGRDERGREERENTGPSLMREGCAPLFVMENFFHRKRERGRKREKGRRKINRDRDIDIEIKRD